MNMKLLNWLGRMEGASLLVLVAVAMPLKYGAGVTSAVSQVGRVHGLLFVAYVIALIVAAVRDRWALRALVFGVVSSMVPAGFVFFEASQRLDNEQR
jgi:integral membrane protein